MLHYESSEWTIATAVVVREGVQPINSAAVLLQPLWTGSTHVMTFWAVTLDWLDHWRSPSTINCTEGGQSEIPIGYHHNSRRLPGCRKKGGERLKRARGRIKSRFVDPDYRNRIAIEALIDAHN